MPETIVPNESIYAGLRTVSSRFSLGSLVGEGFSAVIDKVSFAASNFFSNILLANWLSQQEYGSFSVALAIFFLVAALHSTLLSEPMLVFGPGKYREHLPLYIGMIFWGHWILAILASILILLSAWGAHYYGQSVLAASLVAMAFASPCILLQWIMRKITYVDGNPHLAAYAGALYLLAMLVGITSLYYLRYLSSVSTFGVMAVSSIFSVCWMIRRIPIRAALRNRFLFQTCLKDHAGYGRWAMGSAFLRWLPSNSYYLFLSIWGGLEASAALRSLMNLLLPFQQLTLALSDVLVPTLVRIRRWKDFKSLALKTLLIWLMASGLYWGCLALFGKTIMMWIYGGRYIEHAGLLWLIALSLVFGTFGAVLGVFLRAVNKPDSIFRAGLCATIITAPFALAAIFFGGLRGTALAITFGSLMTAATMAWFCWQGLDPIRTSKAESLESLL